MRSMVLTSTLIFLGLSAEASAQRLTAQCQALFDQITADVPVNVEQCAPARPEYTLATCVRPPGFDGELPASHLILAIDASGSMAGKVGNETKMAIAKREAVSFLSELDENISVGLVVYGHRGNNQAEGKAESCASSEMIHGFDADRADLARSIAGLTPTGWTPMGGVLSYAGELVSALPTPDEGEALAPVVYLISDGEETCESDPVAAAGALYQAGVRTTVNTIGFAVDAQTQAQLRAVAKAGGGTFYPAETGSVLRQRLREIAQAEIDMIGYESCVMANANRIGQAFTRATIPAMQCYKENNPQQLQRAVTVARKNAAAGDPLYEECGRKMLFEASDIAASSGNFVSDVIYPFQDIGRVLQNEHLKEQGFPPRFPSRE